MEFIGRLRELVIAERERLERIQTRLNRTFWITLAEDLSFLLDAGLSMSEAMLQIERTARTGLRYLQQAREGLSQGWLLSTAFEEVSPANFLFLLRLGEASGELSRVLQLYVSTERTQAVWKAKFVKDFSYPALMMLILAILFVFLKLRILPMFVGMYTELHVPITGTLTTVVRLLTILPVLILVLGLSFVGYTAYTLRQMYSTEARQENRRSNFFVRVLETHKTYTFCSRLRILLAAGSDVIESLQELGKNGHKRWLREHAEKGCTHIESGGGVADAFPGRWDPVFLHLLQVAEETGEFPEILLRIECYAEAALHSKMERLTSILEPALVLFMGLVVAIAMYVVFIPMYDFMSSMPMTGGS